MKLIKDCKHMYRCTTMKCQKEISYVAVTFFESGRLALKMCLSYRITGAEVTRKYSDIKHEIKMQDGSMIGDELVMDWMNFFRDICIKYCIDKGVRI